MTYELYYWPMLPGRGEYVRLTLVEAGVDWVDVAQQPKEQGGGIPAVLRARAGELGGLPAYAPPILKAGELVISQTANICHFLACRHGLIHDDESSRAMALQLSLTLHDVVTEVHATHHPIAMGKYYEDQRSEAIENARSFREERMPKLLGYFEGVAGEWLLGDYFTYVDLALFQTMAGLEYAFPTEFARQAGDYPRLIAICEKVAARPRIAAWIADRPPFNEHGIFRRYLELDAQ